MKLSQKMEHGLGRSSAGYEFSWDINGFIRMLICETCECKEQTKDEVKRHCKSAQGNGEGRWTSLPIPRGGICTRWIIKQTYKQKRKRINQVIKTRRGTRYGSTCAIEAKCYRNETQIASLYSVHSEMNSKINAK